MATRTAEDQDASRRMRLHRGPQTLHALTANDSLFEFCWIKSAVSPRDLAEVHSVLDADVVKWNERLFSYSVPNGGVICQVVVKDGGNIDAVRPFRRRRQAEHEVDTNPGEHTAITRRVSVMHFVHDHIVEVLFSKPVQSFRTRQFLHRRNHQIATEFTAIGQVPRRAPFCEYRIQNQRKCSFGLSQNMCSMGNHQDSRPSAEFLSNLSGVKCGQPCLAHASGDRDQSPRVASLPKFLQFSQCRCLPWARNKGKFAFVSDFRFEVCCAVLLRIPSIHLHQFRCQW